MLSSWKINSLRKKADTLFEKRKDGRVDDVDTQKEIKIHMQLARLYSKYTESKKYPYAKELLQESYRVAASLNDAEAQYQLSKIMLEKARFWEELQSSCYQADIHKEYINNCYREVFSFMQAAEEQSHPLAIRQHGMALIHGHGVEINQEEGYKYIVDSIDKEGAWGNATKIFEELGLNKPEFFNSIMAIKNKNTP